MARKPAKKVSKKASKKARTKKAGAEPAKKRVKTSASKPAAKTSPKKKTAAKAPAKRKPAAKSASSGKAAKAAAPKARSKTYELKTKQNEVSVDSFLANVDNPKRVEQARIAIDMLRRVTGEEPKMWGPSIVGFGKYRYVYDSGHSGEMCVAGFSPRKAQFVFYVLGHPPETDEIWSRLGKYKLGGSCLYVNKFEDVDLGVLEDIQRRSVAFMRKKYPG